MSLTVPLALVFATNGFTRAVNPEDLDRLSKRSNLTGSEEATLRDNSDALNGLREVVEKIKGQHGGVDGAIKEVAPIALQVLGLSTDSNNDSLTPALKRLFYPENVLDPNSSRTDLTPQEQAAELWTLRRMSADFGTTLSATHEENRAAILNTIRSYCGFNDEELTALCNRHNIEGLGLIDERLNSLSDRISGAQRPEHETLDTALDTIHCIATDESDINLQGMDAVTALGVIREAVNEYTTIYEISQEELFARYGIGIKGFADFAKLVIETEGVRRNLEIELSNLAAAAGPATPHIVQERFSPGGDLAGRIHDPEGFAQRHGIEVGRIPHEIGTGTRATRQYGFFADDQYHPELLSLQLLAEAETNELSIDKVVAFKYSPQHSIEALIDRIIPEEEKADYFEANRRIVVNKALAVMPPVTPRELQTELYYIRTNAVSDSPEDTIVGVSRYLSGQDNIHDVDRNVFRQFLQRHNLGSMGLESSPSPVPGHIRGLVTRTVNKIDSNNMHLDSINELAAVAKFIDGNCFTGPSNTSDAENVLNEHLNSLGLEANETNRSRVLSEINLSSEFTRSVTTYNPYPGDNPAQRTSKLQETFPSSIAELDHIIRYNLHQAEQQRIKAEKLPNRQLYEVQELIGREIYRLGDENIPPERLDRKVYADAYSILGAARLVANRYDMDLEGFMRRHISIERRPESERDRPFNPTPSECQALLDKVLNARNPQDTSEARRARAAAAMPEVQPFDISSAITARKLSDIRAEVIHELGADALEGVPNKVIEAITPTILKYTTLKIEPPVNNSEKSRAQTKPKSEDEKTPTERFIIRAAKNDALDKATPIFVQQVIDAAPIEVADHSSRRSVKTGITQSIIDETIRFIGANNFETLMEKGSTDITFTYPRPNSDIQLTVIEASPTNPTNNAPAQTDFTSANRFIGESAGTAALSMNIDETTLLALFQAQDLTQVGNLIIGSIRSDKVAASKGHTSGKYTPEENPAAKFYS